MSDLGTMTQEILDDLHVLTDQATVWRKIIDSCKFHRANRWWISERTFKFTLTAGKRFYAQGDGFPLDAVEFCDPMYLWLNGSSNSQQPVRRATPQEMDLWVAGGDSPANPEHWDYDAKRLRLWPTPINSTDVLTGRYVSDIGVPTVHYNTNSGAYDFKAPNGEPLTAAYTNDWFLGGAPLVRARAIYLLAVTLKDPQTDDFQTRWLEEQAKMEEESDARVGGGLRIVSQMW